MTNQSALIIIDMINDFIYGTLKCPHTKKIIANIKQTINWAHKNNISVIYVNDAHYENDIEFKIWKPHALINSYGAQIINELKPCENDLIFTKRNYNAFINTNLDAYLKNNHFTKLYVCGVYTDICVKEFVCTGFQLGYEISVLKDATATKNKLIHYKTLRLLNKYYNAKIIKTTKLINKK
ncbi:MAG: cysteine hydrolase [Ureaplasma sp.]|nr:cysteine hydrolase [Ureaplasma sp.]